MFSRRQFIKYAITAGVMGLITDGFFFEPGHIVVEKKTIAIKNLPDAFEGFRICQITDVHHSRFVGLKFIEKTVEMANSLNPDLTVLTGDYIDDSREYIVPAINVLSKLKSRNGLMAVLGNHDHYEDAKFTGEVLDAYHVSVITNSHKLVEAKGKAVCIAGVDDLWEGRQDLAKALSGVPADIPRILLSHNPDYAEVMPKNERVDLILSGHTHGGQVRIPFFSFAPVTMSNYGQKYAGGLVKLAHTQVYVSRGLGMVGLPVRFNCPPEITLITLAKAVEKA